MRHLSAPATTIIAALLPLAAFSSSHREAPNITRFPTVDSTDVYTFMSYEPGREEYVTLLANYLPLQDPYGGPNYFALDPSAVYEIHVDNDGDARENLTFQFRFDNDLGGNRNRGLAVPVGQAGKEQNIAVPLKNIGGVSANSNNAQTLNFRESYSLTLVRGDRRKGDSSSVRNSSSGDKTFGKPYDFVGTKTFGSIDGYESYANQFIYTVDIPGCSQQGRVFVGQRNEPFVVNLGPVFDLINFVPIEGDSMPGAGDGKGFPGGITQSDANDIISDKNITTLALEVHKSCLVGSGNGVIGVWTSASLPQVRVLNPRPKFEIPDVAAGALTQISRLGMPLVNEVVIGLPDKDRFSASEPKDDGQFLSYVTNPSLPFLIDALFNEAVNGVVEPDIPNLAPNNFPREDLKAAFLTGFKGVNQLARVTPSEMQRLNTGIAPTAKDEQNTLGVAGGDLAGFPNGRRPGDDVVDTELRVAMGVEGTKVREEGRSGVRFVVTVGGREAFRRDVNPAAARRDRRWVEATVPLPAEPGEAEIVLETTAVDAGLPLAGRPGWSALRVVRRTRVPRQAPGPGAPNLLVLLVDTLRADAVGAYGAAAPTPTLDALAARGLVFEQAVAAASWTLPSVASLLTGLHAVSHGVVGSRDDAWGGDFLPDTLVTWPEAAARAGITTVGVSSNPLVSRATNVAQGFETFVELPWDPEGRDWPTADEVNDAFLGWLARNRGRRFAAWLHYMDVHDPYMPETASTPAPPPDARPVVARGRVNDVAKAVNFGRMPPLADAHVRHLRALYDAEVQEWDAALARLLAGLRAAGVADDTVVVVTADHGEEFQEHGHLKHASHLYDEVLRVPLVLAGPGIRPGRVAEQVAGVDLAPTLLALLRLPVPEGVAGADLLAARPAVPALSETRKAVGRDGKLTRLVSLRRSGWKVIEAPAIGAVEVYDLRRDAAERNNLAAAPESAALRGELAQVLAVAPPPPAHAGTDPEMAEKLRALGYAR